MGVPTKEAVYRSMKRLFKSYMRGCRRRNIFWELTLEHFQALTSDKCHYCKRAPSQKSRNYTYNGIDRLNNRQGYQKGNVVSCCRECNMIKGDRLTHDEMLAVGEALVKFRAAREKMREKVKEA